MAMRRFDAITAIAAPIEEVNLDTDQILPARYLRKPRDARYHRYLFADLRFDSQGRERPDFVLNRAPYRDAEIIVGARNFGCGSSREAAVYALEANGIRAVIAPSFGDIFFDNCLANGLLPIRLADDAAAALRGGLRRRPGARVAIDLAAQSVTAPDGGAHAFEIDAFRKRRLLEGLDDIALTLEHEAAMTAFETAHAARYPWKS